MLDDSPKNVTQRCSRHPMFRNLEAFNIKNNSVILQILFSPLVLFQLLFEATFMILIATNMTFEIKFP